MNSTNILHNFSGSVKEESMENLSLYQITNAFPALMESEEITEDNLIELCGDCHVKAHSGAISKQELIKIVKKRK